MGGEAVYYLLLSAARFNPIGVVLLMLFRAQSFDKVCCFNFLGVSWAVGREFVGAQMCFVLSG